MRRLVRRIRSFGVDYTVVTFALTLLLAACSSPDDRDGPDPTATQPAALATSTSAPAPATATATTASQPSATSTATSEPATATSPPASPTATTAPPTASPTRVQPTATATAVPLPSGGAELRVVGKPIEWIVPGDAAGSVLYAITAGGISRSTNGGTTWTASGAVQDGAMVAALNDPNVLYAGSEAACARGGGDLPLVRSTDGGRTWETFTGGQGIRPLLLEAGMSSTLVGTSCLLQVSYDGGQSWTPVDGAVNHDAYAAASSSPDALDDHVVVLAIAEGGTSVAWLIDMSGDEPALEGVIQTFFATGAVAWSDGRIVLATSTGVLVSDDDGANWTSSRDGLEEATYSVSPLEDPLPPAEQGRDFGFSVVRIDPDDADRIWIGGANGAFASDDGGQTWHRLGGGTSVDSLALSTAHQRVYVSSSGETRVWGFGE